VYPQGAPNGPIRWHLGVAVEQLVRLYLVMATTTNHKRKEERLTCHKHGHVEFFLECLQLDFSMLIKSPSLDALLCSKLQKEEGGVQGTAA
jgi:hypothetical protein